MRGFGDYEIDSVAGTIKARDWKDVTDIVYPEGNVGTITTAFGAKNYSNHQELISGSVVVTSSSFGGYQEGLGTLRASGGDLGGGSENLVVYKE
jgi:hypothetical protein